MRRLIFNDEHDVFRDQVRRFMLIEVSPHAERWRDAGIVDHDIWLKAGQQGFLMMWADERYGGAGVDDIRFDIIFSEELTKHGDTGFAITLHNRVIGPYLNHPATDEQRARILPACVKGERILALAITEPGTGSDVSGIRAHAENHGTYWLLNGPKTYISNGILSDLVIVVAKLIPTIQRRWVYSWSSGTCRDSSAAVSLKKWA